MEDSGIAQELARLRMDWNNARQEKDAGMVDRLMVEEYVYVAPNGQVLERGALLCLQRNEV